MAQLKRYNGTSWENVGGSIAPKTSQTTSDTDTYSCNYVNDNLTDIKSAINKYNDTSGADLKTMLKNKLDYCVDNIETNETNFQAFINGGWAGEIFGYGLFSKIGTFYQLTWICNRGIYYIQKNGSTYTFSGGTSFNYDTNERIIGTWTDGKPIYRKVINGGTVTETNTQIGTISNLDTLVSIKGTAHSTALSNQYYNIPNTHNDNPAYYIDALINNGSEVRIRFGTGITQLENVYVIVEYTKTTD